jgi:hypothetical protein
MAPGPWRKCSCSLPMKCFAVATTPWDWIPRIVSYEATPWRKGSDPKPGGSQPIGELKELSRYAPSQFLPPAGCFPRGPIAGPSVMCTPFPRFSAPSASPRARINSLSQVPPVVMPAGNDVILSANRRPRGPSWRHREGNPRRGTGPVLPTQGPMAHPVPVVIFTVRQHQSTVPATNRCHNIPFSVRVICDTSFSAFA